MASTILLPLPQPALFTGHRRSSIKPPIPASFDTRRKPNTRFPPTFAAFAAASSSSSWEQEEQRWLREEQRWLREEQRWLREELRWSSEREALLREIASLRLRIEDLEGSRSPLAPAVNAVLMAEKKRRLLTNADPLTVEEAEVEEIVREETMIPEEKGKVTPKGIMARRTVRMGSEGEEVREMQEALLRLGFFSGEDDMEYSSFSSGTESAVKTWQASLGAAENGIMTAELLEKLFVEQSSGETSQKRSEDQRGNSEPVERNEDGTNGVASASVRKFAEMQHEAVTKKADVAEIGASLHRVFLLGEHRWEEPLRLQSDKSLKSSRAASRAQCLTCRGEGRLMCMECDGSGEPNVEPQFLEWIEEGSKCPYCEGHGYIVCDVCEGKSIAQT